MSLISVELLLEGSVAVEIMVNNTKMIMSSEALVAALRPCESGANIT